MNDAVRIPKFNEIDFGDVDANVEYVKSVKRNSSPNYSKAFVEPPLSYWSEFLEGERFIISGQKGTGKTALLRRLEQHFVQMKSATDFTIFKDDVIEEADLFEGVITGAIDQGKLENSKHYLHILKRIMILKMIKLGAASRSKTFFGNYLEDTRIGNILKRLYDSDLSDVVTLAFDTAHDVASAVGAENIPQANKADFGRLIKSQNDTLLKFLVEQSVRHDLKLKLFFDEIHFALKDKETFRRDAMLVRDCLDAAMNLNQHFFGRGVDCLVYIAVRSEFLEHPVIAQAEIAKQVSSYGEDLSWATYPNDDKHAIWNIAFERAKLISPNLKRGKFIDTYIGKARASEFLKHAWAKPRDVVRFFVCAKKLYGGKSTLNHQEFRAVLREYCIEAWKENRTALASFFDENGISEVEEFLGNNSEKQYSDRTPLVHSEFMAMLTSASADPNLDVRFCAKMLYVLGVIVMENEAGNQRIFNAYHRNNLQPKWEWDLFFHMAVARRFS